MIRHDAKAPYWKERFMYGLPRALTEKVQETLRDKYHGTILCKIFKQSNKFWVHGVVILEFTATSGLCLQRLLVSSLYTFNDFLNLHYE